MEKIKSKDILFSKDLSINLKGRLMHFDIPKVMGILNVTPDSNYDGNLYTTREKISDRIGKMIAEGADIIDIGGYSSKPWATEVSEEEELKRLIPAFEIVLKQYPDIPFSVDTFRPEIAKIAIKDYGASMINDITAFNGNGKMLNIIAEYKVPYIIMHMQGNPGNMQNNPVYSDVVNELVQFFAEKLHYLKSIGINDYIIDPGFGFGKTIDHNYTVLKELNYFKVFECPILIGLSRKSMIYKYLNTDITQALNGTTALHMAALIKGANILRVHDVKEAVETIKLFKKLI